MGRFTRLVVAFVVFAEILTQSRAADGPKSTSPPVTRRLVERKKAELAELAAEIDQLQSELAKHQFHLHIQIWQTEPQIAEKLDELRRLIGARGVTPEIENRFKQFIEAGQVKMIANPTLHVTEGKSENLLAGWEGAEFATKVRAPITYGIRIDATVLATDDDLLTLDLHLKLEEADRKRGISVNGVAAQPAVSSREFNIVDETAPGHALFLSAPQGGKTILILIRPERAT